MELVGVGVLTLYLAGLLAALVWAEIQETLAVPSMPPSWRASRRPPAAASGRLILGVGRGRRLAPRPLLRWLGQALRLAAVLGGSVKWNGW